MPNDLAMLLGNGLSIAFSQKLLLNNITAQVIDRLTERYKDRSDDVAQAMQKLALRARADNPSGDFESLIGAFGGQTDILEDLRRFAVLTENDHEIAIAISKVQLFIQGVIQRGIGHTLEVIVENSHPRNGSYSTISKFLETAIDAFVDRVTIANLNYDALVLTVLTADYKDSFCDMGEGWTVEDLMPLSAAGSTAQTLRSTDSFPAKRIKLLDLHGSVTFWKVGNRYLKIPLDAARDPRVWDKYRNLEVMAFPLVVLANQNDKIDHVKKQPFKLAYDVADLDFRRASHWLIAGYSFRDTCVNDLLKECWSSHLVKPRLIIVTMGADPAVSDVENAFGWEAGSLSNHGARIERSGVARLIEKQNWKWFAYNEADQF